MITQLSLKSWKSHLDSDFEFSQGVNCIIGNMGSGKSSIMQAISFALFGTFPALQNRKIKIDDLIMKKPQNKNTAEVSLAFESNGKKYIINRRIEAGKGTAHAEILENNIQLNVNPAAVNAEVQRILQIDYELFSKAVYSEQNELDYFLRIPKGNRMQQIDKMLKVDRFESAREGIVRIKNKLLYQNEEKIKILTEFEKKDLDRRLNELKAEVRKMEKEKTLFGIDFKRFADTKNRLEEQISKFDIKKDRLIIIEKELASLEASLDEMKKSLDEMRAKADGKTIELVLMEKEKIERDIKLTEKNISDNKDFANRLREGIASLSAMVSELEKNRMPDLEKKIQLLSEQMSQLDQLKEKLVKGNHEEEKKELEKLGQNISSMHAKHDEAQKQVAELESAKATCPVCSRELTEEHRERVLKEKHGLLGSLQADIEKNSIIIRELKESIDSVEKDKQKMLLIEERVSELGPLKIEISDSRKKIQEYRKNVNDNVTKIQAVEITLKNDEEKIIFMRESFIETKNLIEMVEKLGGQEKKITEYVSMSRSLLQEKALLENAIKGIEIEETKKRYSDALAREAEMHVKISSIGELLKEKQTRLSGMESEYSTMKKYQDEITKDRKITNDLNTFLTVLRATQSQLREEFLKTVNSLMNEIWADLYPYDDFDEIRFAIDGGDYSLQLKSSEGWANVEGIVSGGERSLACLALRIAFSMTFIPNLKWLILDEPTHNLDHNAITQFAEILREKIHKFANQVFLITHEDRISEGVTGHFYRLERNKELDEPTRVIRF